MSTSHMSRAAVAVTALLLAVVVSGCEEDEPSTSPTPSSSPSEPESSSPSEPTTTDTGPVEPTLPAEAESETQRGVTEFVGYYFDVINYATSTGDTDLLSTLDQPSCNGCHGGIDFVERVYRNGGRIIGGTYELLRLEPVRSPSGHWTVVARTHLDDQRVVGAGKLNEAYPGGRAKWIVGVARVRDAWSVTTLDIL
jgi:hypothetical protein